MANVAIDIDTAKKCAEEVLSEYGEKLSEFGLITSVDKEYETADFDDCEYESKKLAMLTLYLNVRAEGMSDDDGLCFGVVIDVNKNREVDSEKLSESLSEFKENITDLVAALRTKDDVKAFLIEETERAKAEGEEAMAELSKKLQRIDSVTKIAMIVAGVVVTIALICVLFIK